MEKAALIARDAELIKDLGGASKVAELLEFDKYGTQRVHNWLTRGIPSSVKLRWPHIFLKTPTKAA